MTMVSPRSRNVSGARRTAESPVASECGIANAAVESPKRMRMRTPTPATDSIIALPCCAWMSTPDSERETSRTSPRKVYRELCALSGMGPPRNASTSDARATRLRIASLRREWKVPYSIRASSPIIFASHSPPPPDQPIGEQWHHRIGPKLATFLTPCCMQPTLHQMPQQESNVTSRARPYLWWGLALLALAAGYADLIRGGETIAPILLVLGYCVLVPIAILK